MSALNEQACFVCTSAVEMDNSAAPPLLSSHSQSRAESDWLELCDDGWKLLLNDV